MRPNCTPIITALDRIANRKGFDFSRVYSDWLALSCHAFAGQEDEYMQIITSYADNHERDDRNADLFAKALAEWQKALAEEYRDYLGEIFEERVSHGEKGQFFTPESLSEMMAQMTMADGIKDGGWVNDPACGSGRNLLAATRINRKARFVAQDIDLNCVRMTSLNLLCRNVDGVAVWGNTLSLETWGGYQFRRGPWGGTLRWMEREEAKEWAEKALKAREQEPEERSKSGAEKEIEPEEVKEREPEQLGFGL